MKLVISRNNHVRNILILLIILGFLIRTILTHSVPSHDAEGFVIWSRYLTSHSLAELYEFLPAGYPPYTPGYYYLLKAIGSVIQLFQWWEHTWLSYFLVQLPVYLADSLLAILIYVISRRWFSRKVSVMSSMFYYLNPAVIYTSAVLGQVDSFVTLFCIGSLYLFSRKKHILSLTTYSIALLIKPQALAVFPLIAVLMLKELSIKRTLSNLLLTSGMMTATIVPVIVSKGFSWTLSYLWALPNWYPYTSIYAFNLWAVIGFMVPDHNILFILSYKYIGLLLLVLISLPVIYRVYFYKRDLELWLFAGFLLFFSFAFFSTRIHSRYLIYSLGFFAPFFYKFPRLGIGLSLLMVANLLLPLKNQYLYSLISVLNQPVTIWFITICGLGLFVLSYRTYLKLLPHKTNRSLK